MSLLRDLFRPSRDEIWRQFASAINGSFTQGSFWKGSSRVEASHGQWMVTLDSYVVSSGETSTIYTRIRAPYVNPDNFRFSLHRSNFLSGLGEVLGIHDVQVGYPEFDQDFVIRGNNENQLRQLFADTKLRELISAQPRIRFWVQDDEKAFWRDRKFPADVDELRFEVTGIIKDLNRLKQLFDLFAEALDQLCRIGSAYQKDPGVKV